MNAQLQKEWFEVRNRIWTYPVVYLVFPILIFNPATSIVFLVLIGAWLASDMAIQTAGDDVRHGSHEFIFTRAIDRKAYLTQKYFFGVGMLVAFVLVAALFELLNLRQLFWNLACDPLLDWSVVQPYPHVVLPLVLVGQVMIFSIVFTLCLPARSEASFSGFVVVAWIATGLYTWVIYAVLSLIMPFGHMPAWDLSTDPRFIAGSTAALLVPSALLLALCRTYYARCELPVVQAASGRRSGASGWFIWIILILAIVLLAMLFLTMRPVAYHGG